LGEIAIDIRQDIFFLIRLINHKKNESFTQFKD